MKFDFTTFVFQVINFVVLLFILKRLLYKPVREIVEKRRKLTEKTVQDAEKTRQEALELKGKYQEETAKLKEVRGQMLEELQKEVMEQKKKLIAKAEEEAGKVTEKEMAILGAEKKRLQAEMKEQAIETACIFASRILRDISDKDLHQSTYRKLLKMLDQVAQDLKRAEEEPLSVELATMYPLSAEELEKFRQQLESLVSRKVAVNAVVDETLIAGARLRAHDKVYNFSLSGQIDLLRTKLKKAV
jgi:F-type H+-transporting ATPase subunit b